MDLADPTHRPQMAQSSGRRNATRMRYLPIGERAHHVTAENPNRRTR